jgi:hypothetical protein
MQQNLCRNLLSFIAGIINVPIADVVAMAEPEMAAKNMHDTVVTIASPPVK